MRQTYTSETTGRRISRERWLGQQIIRQRAWIERCHASARSYTGPNAIAIMAADRESLRNYETQLAAVRGGEEAEMGARLRAAVPFGGP